MATDSGPDGARLREAAQRFQRVFEDGPIAMALVGDDFRLGEVNDAFCRLTGYTASELAERTFSDITHPDDVHEGLRLARLVFAGELPSFSLDKRYLRKGGEVIWVQLTVSVIRDERGRPIRGLGIVQDITARRRALADTESALERLAGDRAARERVQAAEAERARWARELHDETLQGLAALHMLLSVDIPPASAAELSARLRDARDQIETEMEKLRGLISELRPAALDELGLEASVRDLAERTQAVYGIEIETVLALHGARLASEVETAAYRIVQESLSNAARHAGARRVVVELSQGDGALELRVRDDGAGFDPSNGRGGGFGLRGMHERVELLDGRLEIASAPSGGTTVAAVLPLAPPQSDTSERSTSPRSST